MSSDVVQGSIELAFIKLDVDVARADHAIDSAAERIRHLGETSLPPVGERPVVVLHGLFGSSANWRTLARGLTAHHCVYLVDARNHGTSPHAPSMSYEEQAGDLAAFVTRHEIEHPVVLGHSMGGKTAMHFALSYPDLVDGLIVVDIAPANYPPDNEHGLLIAAMLDLPDTAMRDRRAADAALAGAVPDPTLRAFLLHNLLRKNGGLGWRINLPALRDSLAVLRSFPGAGTKSQCSPFKKPTLFLSGGASAYVREEHRQGIVRRFPQASFDVIPGAGHWVHAEKPQAVLGSVQHFLASM